VFKLSSAIFASVVTAGLMAAPAAFAEDKNATQTNSGPARDTSSNSSHVAVPAPKEAGSETTRGDKHSADHSKGPPTTAAPTQTSGHDQSR
jgi:hypothetical protein